MFHRFRAGITDQGFKVNRVNECCRLAANHFKLRVSPGFPVWGRAAVAISLATSRVAFFYRLFVDGLPKNSLAGQVTPLLGKFWS